jgi:hypothetical protein
MGTTWAELESAALSLARSGPIKDRLIDAYRNHLALVNVDDLPEVLRADFRACHDALTHERPLRGEDAVRATVRKMSSQEAEEIACCVMRLFAASVREATRQLAPAASEVMLNGTANGAAARVKVPKGVPQVISLYASAEA